MAANGQATNDTTRVADEPGADYFKPFKKQAVDQQATAVADADDPKCNCGAKPGCAAAECTECAPVAPAPPAEEGERMKWRVQECTTDLDGNWLEHSTFLVIERDDDGKESTKGEFYDRDDADAFAAYLNGASPEHARIRELERIVVARDEKCVNLQATIRELEQKVEQLNAMLRRANEQIEKKDRALMSATPAQPAKPEMGKREFGIELMAAERERQLAKWSASHDDTHLDGAILEAAMCLLERDRKVPACVSQWPCVENRDLTPYHERLITAGALVAAEYDRFLRACNNENKPEPTPSPHVETGGQEPKCNPENVGWKACQFGAVEPVNWLLFHDGQMYSKEQAEAAARDLAAMAAVRKYRLELFILESTGEWWAERTNGNLCASTDAVYADPADAILALASQLSASQADQQDGKERA